MIFESIGNEVVNYFQIKYIIVLTVDSYFKFGILLSQEKLKNLEKICYLD
jgi:hypothetical protein